MHLSRRLFSLHDIGDNLLLLLWNRIDGREPRIHRGFVFMQLDGPKYEIQTDSYHIYGKYANSMDELRRRHNHCFPFNLGYGNCT